MAEEKGLSFDEYFGLTGLKANNEVKINLKDLFEEFKQEEILKATRDAPKIIIYEDWKPTPISSLVTSNLNRQQQIDAFGAYREISEDALKFHDKWVEQNITKAMKKPIKLETLPEGKTLVQHMWNLAGDVSKGFIKPKIEQYISDLEKGIYKYSDGILTHLGIIGDNHYRNKFANRLTEHLIGHWTANTGRMLTDKEKASIRAYAFTDVNTWKDKPSTGNLIGSITGEIGNMVIDFSLASMLFGAIGTTDVVQKSKTVAKIKKMFDVIAKKMPKTFEIAKDTIKFASLFSTGRAMARATREVGNAMRGEFVSLNDSINKVIGEMPKDFAQMGAMRLLGSYWSSWWKRLIGGAIGGAGVTFLENRSQILKDLKKGDYSSLSPVILTATMGGLMDALFPVKLKLKKEIFLKNITKLSRQIAKKTKINQNIVNRLLARQLSGTLGFKNVKELPEVIDAKMFKLKKFNEYARNRLQRLREKFPKASPRKLINAIKKEVKDGLAFVDTIEANIRSGKPVKFKTKEFFDLLKKKRISTSRIEQESGINREQLRRYFRRFVGTYSPTEEKLIEKTLKNKLPRGNTAQNLINLFKRKKRELNKLYKPLAPHYKALKTIYEVKPKHLGVVHTTSRLVGRQKMGEILEFNKEKKNLFEIFVIDNKNFGFRLKPGVKMKRITGDEIKQEISRVAELFTRIGRKSSISFSFDPESAQLYSKAKSTIYKYLEEMRDKKFDRYKDFADVDNYIFDDTLVTPDEAILFINTDNAFKNQTKYNNLYDYVRSNKFLKRIFDNQLASIKMRGQLTADDILNKQSISGAIRNLVKFKNAEGAVANLPKFFQELRENTDDFEMVSDELVRLAGGLENTKRGLFKRLFSKPIGELGMVDALFAKHRLGKKTAYDLSDAFQRLYLQTEQGIGTVDKAIRRTLEQMFKGVSKDYKDFYFLNESIIGLNNLHMKKKITKDLFMRGFRRISRNWKDIDANAEYFKRFDKWINGMTEDQFQRTMADVWNKQRIFNKYINDEFVKFTKTVNQKLGKRIGVDLGVEYFIDTDIRNTKDAMIKTLEADDRFLASFEPTVRAHILHRFDLAVHKKGFNNKSLTRFIEEFDIGRYLKDETIDKMRKQLDVLTELFKKRTTFFPTHLGIKRDGFSLAPDKYHFAMREQMKKQLGIDVMGSVYANVLAVDPVAVYTRRFSDFIQKYEFAKMLAVMRKMKVGKLPVVFNKLPTNFAGYNKGQLERFYVRLNNLIDVAKPFKGSMEKSTQWYVLNPFARSIKDLIQNSTRNKILGGTSSLISRLKVLRFYKPFILWRYGAEQNFLASPRSFRYLIKAFKGMRNMDEDYITASQLGLFNRSIMYRDMFQNMKNDMDNFLVLSKPRKGIPKIADKIWKGARALDYGYRKGLKGLQELAWAGDEIMRLAQYKSWIARGYNPSEAVKKAQLFSMHYDRWNTSSRRLLNILFRYPTYRIQSLRLYNELLKGSFGGSKILTKGEARMSLMRAGGLKMAKIYLLGLAGYTWGGSFFKKKWQDLKKIKKDQGIVPWVYENLMEYRGFKEVGDRDERRILGAVFSGPTEEIPKLVMRGLWGSVIMNLSDGLIIPYQIFNNRGDDWQPIIKGERTLGGYGISALKYALKKYFPPLTELKQMSMDGISAQEKIMAMLGLVNYLYYTDSIKDYKEEINNIQLQMRKEKDAGDRRELATDIQSVRIKIGKLKQLLRKFEKYRKVNISEKFGKSFVDEYGWMFNELNYDTTEIFDNIKSASLKDLMGE